MYFHNISNVPRGTMTLIVLSFCFAIMGISFSSCSDKSGAETLPNIVWIVAEDLSPVIPSFGDSTISTPHLSRLAEEGVCYDNVFSPSGVCSPSRAAIATGMYPTHIGANHMRTGPWFPGITEEFIKQYAKNAMPPGLVPYETVPPSEVRMMSEILRTNGYYCTNNSKEDYQFMKSVVAWDESSRNAHWRNRKGSQPFFSVFNLNVTHESQIWARANDTLLLDTNLEVPVPPYLPDTEIAKDDIRRMYSNIKVMDNQVGEIISQLEEDGLLEDTYVFWYSDHGGPLPRQKRLTYDSGIRVPMIIRFPNKENAGSRDDQLVSFIDFAPTILSLAYINPPDYLDGQAFLGKHKSDNKRTYIHAAADRFDESVPDRIRTVRDDRYKLIRYYDRELPMFLHVGYRDQMPIMRELSRLKETNQLTDAQALWFRDKKPVYELFDTQTDPHEVNDLFDDGSMEAVKSRLIGELDKWLASFEDLNMIPEEELIAKFWPEGQKPRTEEPFFSKEGGKIQLDSRTEGASIGYRVFSGVDTVSTWKVYTHPITITKDQKVVAIAHRLGYYPSPMVYM